MNESNEPSANERLAALGDAVREVTGKDMHDLPVSTTLREHNEATKRFRLELSRAFPEMSNGDADRIANLAMRKFWPGPQNGFGRLFPGEVTMVAVQEARDRIAREIHDRASAKAEEADPEDWRAHRAEKRAAILEAALEAEDVMHQFVRDAEAGRIRPRFGDRSTFDEVLEEVRVARRKLSRALGS